MSIMDMTAWSLIIGLSLISVGGLLIWAYGDSVQAKEYQGALRGSGAVEARRKFVGVLVYSVVMIVVGMVLALQGTFFLLSGK